MKEKLAHTLGWVLIVVCIAMILVHSYNIFLVEYPPYNVAKGNIEVGVIGLLIFCLAKILLSHRENK